MYYLKNSYRSVRHLIIIPIVSTLIIPLVILDIWVEIYHRFCFPLYKFSYVKRSSYIEIDRHKLKYLTFWQKGYCIYCGYGNGLANYFVKIAAETERYWCGIQHKKDKNFIPPKHHQNFTEYDNEEAFKQKYKS